ncbi:MAG: DUF2141 domain-containing protein [Chlorobiaceae bacterium]
MKKLPLLIAVFFLILPASLPAENAFAPSSCIQGESGCITIKVCGLKNTIGQLGIALYSSKKGFPDNTETALATRVRKISDTTQEFTFENIPFGSYAISVLHDENSNGRMDKFPILGIPKEGFGVSNNPKIRRGPPSFSESLFVLSAGEMKLSITMNYL